MKEKLFEQMMAAIELKNEKELEYLLAKRDADRLTALYRSFCNMEREVEAALDED